jgi:GNAT superfamily N-acetyltransferase
MSVRTPDTVGDPGPPNTGVAPRLVVRQARREDLPAILALLAADAIREVSETVPAGTPGPDGDAYDVEARYLAAFEEITDDPNTLLLVGELPSRPGAGVVATCQLTFLRHLMYHGGRVAQVELVRTSSPLRGRGIGRTLMDWVVAESRRRGAVRLQLTSNRARLDAHRFYERLGFRATHVGMKLYLGDDGASSG